MFDASEPPYRLQHDCRKCPVEVQNLNNCLLYFHHSDVKLLLCQFWGFLASMCEGTPAPPCELTVNKPLLINMLHWACLSVRPRPLLVDITQPPPGPIKALSSSGVNAS